MSEGFFIELNMDEEKELNKTLEKIFTNQETPKYSLSTLTRKTDTIFKLSKEEILNHLDSFQKIIEEKSSSYFEKILTLSNIEINKIDSTGLENAKNNFSTMVYIRCHENKIFSNFIDDIINIRENSNGLLGLFINYDFFLKEYRINGIIFTSGASVVDALRLLYPLQQNKIQDMTLKITVAEKEAETWRKAYEKSIDDKDKEIKNTLENFSKTYIKVCESIKKEEPTLKDLNEASEMPINQWQQKMDSTLFWHFLQETTLHKINQAKNPDKKNFWIKVNKMAFNKYADLSMKEYKNKEKNLSDLSDEEMNSF